MDSALFILILICHWAGDFTHLSRPYMLKAKKFGKPLQPILDHAAIHAFLMAMVVLFYCDRSIMMGVNILGVFFIQLISHTTIDLLKGRCNGWFPILQDNTKYPHWYVFGLDQVLHILIIVVITNLVT